MSDEDEEWTPTDAAVGPTVHQNDANARPRLYGRVATPDGEVELTAEGAEGEDMKDIEQAFDDKLDRLVEAQSEFVGEDEDGDRKTFN